MIAIRSFFFAAAFLAAAVISSPAPPAGFNTNRDPTHKACDPAPGSPAHPHVGSAKCFIQETDRHPYYLTPELGACGVTYNDNMLGACLNPGWVESGYYNSCGRKTTVMNPANKKSIEVVIIDSCISDDAKHPFHCNDISLTKAAFLALGGNPDDGYLANNVKWYFNDQKK
ncbi:hypothetical protein A4X13_0g5539 [Tilletia indica]|uniref:RlpA-like protein double-psi beta-barrel domain-containing protein n=1 Tax=Tilletia indica TaxID=43049 RepID=A0A177T6K4_9BASI|nr:hypothetical protein A4X13_0g5539 [Tilletia indica]